MPDDNTNSSTDPGNVVGPEQPTNPVGPTVLPPASTEIHSAPVTMPGSGPKKSNKKKLLLGIVIGLIILIGGSAGAYFGTILPNKPENMWKAALENTADGYDRLVEYSSTKKDIKGVKAKGSLKLEGTAAGDGKIDAQTYEGNGKYNFDIGFAGSRYELEGLTIVPEGAKSPDMYFRVKGIKGLGGLLQASPFAETGPFLDSLDGQWIFVDHTLFDQLASTAKQQSTPSLSRDDITTIAKAVGEVNRDYLFSDTPDKQVLTVAQQIGREDRDGRSTYHYKVGVNKENLKMYITALKERLKQTKLKELFGEESYNQYFDSLLANIDRQNFEASDTADVWVDTKTKLIRIIRFTDKKQTENYAEVGLLYNGGDEYPFLLDFHFPKDSQPGTALIKTTLNTKTDTVKIDLTADLTGEEKEKITGELTLEPNNQPVEVTKPEGAKPVMEIVGALYGGFLGGFGGELDSSGLDQPFPIDDLDI
jgi:hypothetical protein